MEKILPKANAGSVVLYLKSPQKIGPCFLAFYFSIQRVPKSETILSYPI